MLSNNHKGVFTTLIFPTIVILAMMFTASAASAQQMYAGPDQTVRDGAAVTLEVSQSIDRGAATARATFTAPTLMEGHNLSGCALELPGLVRFSAEFQSGS